MTPRSLETRIVQALADALKRDASTIRPDAQLREDLGLDSLAVIELLFKLEETFDLQIPDQDLPALTTVRSVVDYIQTRLSPPAKTSSVKAKKKSPATKAKSKK